MKTFTEDDLKRIYLCSAPQNDCFLRRGENCPRTQSISLQSLHLDKNEKICFVLWDAGELVKKVMDTSAYLRELESEKYMRHSYIRDLQRSLIHDTGTALPQKAVMFHFEFTKNGTVLLPTEVQSFHKKTHVSLFTSVVTSTQGTQSLAVVSGDTAHTSAHALLATKAIKEYVDEHYPCLFRNNFWIRRSGGAFQESLPVAQIVWEAVYSLSRWIFSVTGHRKGACDGVGGVLMVNSTRRSGALSKIREGGTIPLRGTRSESTSGR